MMGNSIRIPGLSCAWSMVLTLSCPPYAPTFVRRTSLPPPPPNPELNSLPITHSHAPSINPPSLSTYNQHGP